MPHEDGSQTLSAAETATAASTKNNLRESKRVYHVGLLSVPALPPNLKISRPASEANGCDEETTPSILC